MAPSPGRLFLVLVLAFALLSVVRVDAQGPPGGVLVNSDLELLSLGNVDGGGRVTWTFTGENATLLRTKILDMFDQSTSIPRGFHFANSETGATTGSVNNGILEEPEAGTYLDRLENQIEGTYRFPRGTSFRYVTITRADRAERDLPADESSAGLVGTSANATGDLEIRFIFNANTDTASHVFAQPDLDLADAPHQVFSFLAAEDLGACAANCYPFPARNGWRVIDAPWFPGGGRFLWHGNRSATAGDPNATNVYDRAASNVTFYSTDGVAEVPVDLRFATNATFSFEHTGGTGSEITRDVLRVQASTNRAAWATLTDAAGSPTVGSVSLDRTVNSTYDLRPYLGQRVYLRLNFTANGDNATAGPGFYLRNMVINAPSTFQGSVDFRHVDYVVGFLSFSSFTSQVTRPTLVRTPVGEILWYSSTYASDAPPGDTARFATFDVLENPQVLFVLLVAAIWIMGWLQDRSWEKYRLRHPAVMRANAVKAKWLVWTGRGVSIVLVLLYFFPTLLGADLFVGGLAFWVLALAALFGVGGGTMLWYARRAKLIPEEPEITKGERLATDLPPPPPPPSAEPAPRLICASCDMDIEEGAPAYTCACGQTYHEAHAYEAGTCKNCGRELKAPPPPEKRMVTLKCPVCEEINVVEEEADLGLTKCTACGVVLKEIPGGYNYLLIADEPSVAYEWFKAVVKKGAPGLCMSTTFPEKLRREYALPDVELYWVSDTNPGPKVLDPKRLDFEIMRALSNFVKNNKGGALVLDGLEYLVVENSFDRVLKFIKKVNDLASVHDATMFVPVTPSGLGPEEMTLLRKEFDKVEVLGQATP